MRGYLGVVLCAAVAACAPLDAARSPAPLAQPGDAVPVTQQTAWCEFALPGKRKTRYAAEWLDGRSVIRADADRSASMWRKPVQIAAADIGTLSFSWLVPRLIESADLSDGDAADSPVRVVLAFEGDRSRLSARERVMFELAHTLTGEPPPYATLMYVWDNKAQPGTVIPGNRSSRIRKIVVDSGPAHATQWRSHTRSITEDFRRAFGEEPGALVGIALMTDSDNTQSRVSAYYGEILLTRADGKPL